MLTSSRFALSLLLFAASTSALACSAADPVAASDEEVDIGVDDLTSRSLTLTAGRTSTVRFTNRAAGATVTVDCSPPADPDQVGVVFVVSAPDLNVRGEPARAALWSWAGPVPAGTHTVSLAAQSSGKCTVKIAAGPAGTCKAWRTHRSPNTNHEHFRVGTDTSSDWEPFPASGNHWGAWAPWSTIYPTAIKRGFLLHNLEHGGAALSYKCAAVAQNPECKAAQDKLVALAQALGNPRILITPDPTQPTMFALRTWRTAYTSDCLDDASALAFLRTHIRHGREDIDADPPIPFDPTTTEVPCQDLMAAPDSCQPR